MRRLILSLTLAGLAAGSVAVPTSAATVRMVDDDGRASPGNCGGSATAARKVQKAVDAADPGDTILVCPGTYRGHVVVKADKDGLTIRSVTPRGAILEAPEPRTRDSVIIIRNGAADITIQHFLVRHRTPEAASAGLCEQFAGIRVDGQDAVIRENHVVAVGQDTLSPCGLPLGIAVGEGGPATATVEGNVIKDVVYGAIVIGPPGVHLEATRNIVRFFHPSADSIGTASLSRSRAARAVRAWRGVAARPGPAGPEEIFFEGIVAFDGATADIIENTVEAARPGRGPISGAGPYLDDGIVVDSTQADVLRNRVYRAWTNIHLYLTGPDTAGEDPTTRVRGNIVTSGYGGIVVETSDVVVRGNRVGANAYGLVATVDSSGNTFRDNDVQNNLLLDCDDNTAVEAGSVLNAWQDNEANTDDPSGICVPVQP